MTMFARVLNSINSRLPVAHQYDDNRLTIKFLTNIDHPDALALEAVTEIDAPTGSRRFERVVNGAPIRDYDACTQHFDMATAGRCVGPCPPPIQRVAPLHLAVLQSARRHPSIGA